jgi:hypothetical protein
MLRLICRVDYAAPVLFLSEMETIPYGADRLNPQEAMERSYYHFPE